MVITRDEKIMVGEVLFQEKELSDISFNALVYVKNNLNDSYNQIYLTVDSFKDISNIIAGSNSITLRKVNVKLCNMMKCI